MPTNKVLEWLGAIFGVAGNILLAVNLPESKWAFIIFVASNMCLIAYAIRVKQWGLCSMFIMYNIITFVGIYRWIIT